MSDSKESYPGDGFVDDGGTEFIMYISLALALVLISVFLAYNFQMFGTGPSTSEPENDAGVRGRNQQPVVNRRRAAAVAARNQRGRRLGADDSDVEVDGEEQRALPSDDDLDEKLNDPKLGAKKRAKLEAKAEKRQQREQEERMREDRKAKQAVEQKERELREQQEAEAEKRREEEEKRLREEKAQRELEEYLKMKEMFSVDQEGCEVMGEEDEGNLLEKFIEHIKSKKVILFEELATQFGLKVPDAIDRLTTLVNEGKLTGVMDDRGKFIYIPEDELTKFAKFIKQRGRVSIADLVENSPSLINLTSETQD